MNKYRFKFFDGTIVEGWGVTERNALRELGLEAYNPVAYDVTIIETNDDEMEE